MGTAFLQEEHELADAGQRPTDNMELAVDLPQEEEFALANMMPYTYYNFWFLPKHMQEYADKYLLFDDISDAELKCLKKPLPNSSRFLCGIPTVHSSSAKIRRIPDVWKSW